MLLLCTLPVGYVIANTEPSVTCGPFAKRTKFYSIITDTVESAVGKEAYEHILFITSPGVVIPVLLLLMLIIYFLVSLCRALRETNEDLKKQLLQERTEEKKKIYALAGGSAPDGETDTLPQKKVSGAFSGVGGQYRPYANHPPRVPQTIAEDYYSSDDDDKSPLVRDTSKPIFQPSLDSLAEDVYQDSADEMGSRVPSVTADHSLGSTTPSRTPTKSAEELNNVSLTLPYPGGELPHDEMQFSTEDLKRMVTPTPELERHMGGTVSAPKLETTIWMPIEEPEPDALMKFSETETDSELDTFSHDRAALPSISENIPARHPPSSEESQRKFKVDDVNPSLAPWPVVPPDARSRLRRVSLEPNQESQKPPIPPSPQRALSLDRSVRRSPVSEEEEDGPPIRLPKFRITSSRETTPVSSPTAYRRSSSAGPRRRLSLHSSAQGERTRDALARSTYDDLKSSYASLSKETTI